MKKRELVGLMGLTIVIMACEKKDPCQKKLELIEPPVTFVVSRSNNEVGRVTVGTDHTLTFEASEKASAEHVAQLSSLIAEASSSGVVSFDYSDEIDGTHYRCGGQVKKDVPQYPAAVRWHLYSEYFDVSRDDAP